MVKASESVTAPDWKNSNRDDVSVSKVHIETSEEKIHTFSVVIDVAYQETSYQKRERMNALSPLRLNSNWKERHNCDQPSKHFHSPRTKDNDKRDSNS